MIEAEFAGRKADVQEIRKRLEQAKAADSTKQLDPAREVESAMSPLDRIERIANDPNARADTRRLLDDLDVRLGLYFEEGIKGPKRKIRVIKSGIITTGGMELPVPPFGSDAVENKSTEVDGGRSPANDDPRREGRSFTKGNRGD